MLELAQIPYDMVMYWNTKEYKDLAPFGQMPLLMGGDLEDEDQILCQSGAIVRYLAKETSLDGSEAGPVGEARADMIWECSKDILGAKEQVKGTEKEKLHGMLTKATEMLEEFEGPFFSGMSVTFGDIGMFNSLNVIEVCARTLPEGASGVARERRLGGVAPRPPHSPAPLPLEHRTWRRRSSQATLPRTTLTCALLEHGRLTRSLSRSRGCACLCVH